MGDDESDTVNCELGHDLNGGETGGEIGILIFPSTAGERSG
jgi:hypothetical protein